MSLYKRVYPKWAKMFVEKRLSLGDGVEGQGQLEDVAMEE